MPFEYFMEIAEVVEAAFQGNGGNLQIGCLQQHNSFFQSGSLDVTSKCSPCISAEFFTEYCGTHAGIPGTKLQRVIYLRTMLYLSDQHLDFFHPGQIVAAAGLIQTAVLVDE